MEANIEIHQADIQFVDGTSTFFVSADGRWFFERGFPEKGAQTNPMRYEREWLKQAARGSAAIECIAFTVREAVRESELDAAQSN